MKKILLIIGVLVILSGGAFYFLNKNTNQSNMKTMTQTNQQVDTSSGVNTNQVKIKDFAFTPSVVKIKVGDHITWTNNDSSTHTATADDNSWNTGELASGKQGGITFSKQGTFTYHCNIHPQMKGTIIVE